MSPGTARETGLGGAGRGRRTRGGGLPEFTAGRLALSLWARSSGEASLTLRPPLESAPRGQQPLHFLDIARECGELGFSVASGTAPSPAGTHFASWEHVRRFGGRKGAAPSVEQLATGSSFLPFPYLPYENKVDTCRYNSNTVCVCM